jgi:hypothetical protein
MFQRPDSLSPSSGKKPTELGPIDGASPHVAHVWQYPVSHHCQPAFLIPNKTKEALRNNFAACVCLCIPNHFFVLYAVRVVSKESKRLILLITDSDWLREADSFLRGSQGFCYSRISQYFMKSEGLLPCSQKSSIGPYPEPDESSLYHAILSF